MANRMFFQRLLVFVGLLALSTVGLWAQGTGTITGIVSDDSGAIIPGVEVTVTNMATNEARTMLTSNSGVYRVPNLLPGRYAVKASLTGFKTAIQEGITLNTDQVEAVNLVLSVGNISESVTVTSEAAPVDTEQGRVSSMVDEKRIEDLPLNGRNIYQLMQLAPGAVNSTATIFEPGQNTNVNGGRANMNGFWMDGITSKSLSGGTGAGDSAGTTPNLEAIQEFRIETLNFSAEFGNSIGSIVSVISKSGSNDFHGSVYEFHRNDNLDARELFDTNKPEFIQNQFGVSFGGPIVKDNTFFFGSYEGARIRTGESATGIFESTKWGQFVSGHGAPVGAFLYKNFPGRKLETVTSSVGQYLVDFGYIDTPTQANVDSFLASSFNAQPGSLNVDDPMTGEANFFTPDATDNDGFSVRIDHDFSDNDKLYGRYFFNNSDGQVVVARPDFNSNSNSRSHQFGLHWTHIMSPTVVNEARTGLTRSIGDIDAGTPGVPRLTDAGSSTTVFGAYNGYPQIFHENIFTWGDTLSITRGDHGMKLGVEVRRNQENSEFNVGRPSFYFFDLVTLAQDDPYYLIGGVDPNFDLGPNKGELASNFRGWRNTEVGVFFNDDWKVKPNLTLNLGLRWDWYSRLQDVQNRTTAFELSRDSSLNFLQKINTGKFIGPVDKLSADDWNNYGPRLGIAWDPFSDGKMSIRAGFGIAFQSGIFNPLANSRWNKPFYSFNLICDVCGRPGETILLGPQDGSPIRADGPNPNIGAGTFEGNIIIYDPTNPNTAFLSGIANPNQRDPYTESFFFGIQRELFSNTTLEVNYVGNLGRKLIRAENPNRFPGDRIGAPNPATGEDAGDNAFNRLNQNEGVLRFWENSVNSNYNALQVQVNRRFSNGFAINSNYTWAKSLDVRSTWHSGATSANRGQEGFSTNFLNINLDYGRSIFDVRQRWVTSFLLDLPAFKNSDNAVLKHVLGGWEFNAITAVQTGQPFTPHCSLSFPRGCDFNADGNNNDRPNAPGIGNALDSGRQDFLNRNGGIFNIAGGTSNKLDFFGRPTAGTDGTLGRNTFDGPGFANVDFSIFKEIPISGLNEEAHLQLRFEFFNLFNRPNLFQPFPRINSSTFGRSTAQFDAREIQLAIKFVF